MGFIKHSVYNPIVAVEPALRFFLHPLGVIVNSRVTIASSFLVFTYSSSTLINPFFVLSSLSVNALNTLNGIVISTSDSYLQPLYGRIASFASLRPALEEISKYPDDKNEALREAVRNGNVMLSFLLVRAGCDPQARDSSGVSAVMIARDIASEWAEALENPTELYRWDLPIANQSELKRRCEALSEEGKLRDEGMSFWCC